eukprot:sb/3477406/
MWSNLWRHRHLVRSPPGVHYLTKSSLIPSVGVPAWMFCLAAQSVHSPLVSARVSSRETCQLMFGDIDTWCDPHTQVSAQPQKGSCLSRALAHDPLDRFTSRLFPEAAN